ncbi:MAG: hypothetical protein NZ889_02095 [Candidatus Pacearchaeota archaeon]|nr:hypothetical protein [Candidatus Pacearchaeota archaeon]
MAKYKSLIKKIRLGKLTRRTRWAPFWIVFKALGKGKKVHPSHFTRIKRHWRKKKIKKKIKREEERREGINFKSGRIEKKY